MRGLQGRRVLVAGSASGIGAATARRLGEEGAHLFLGDLDVEGAGRVAQEVVAAGGSAAAGYFDLHDEGSTERLVAEAVEVLGGLDGVAAVAADLSPEVNGRDLGLLEMDVTVWERTLRANLIGTALILKGALPHLFEAGGGSIVTVTSGNAHVGDSVRVAYGSSKAGINVLTRHIAHTYGGRGVRANAVSPGLIMSEAARVAIPEAQQASIRGRTPLGRLGEPEDVARTIAFLLSDDADWVSGQVWSVNGGLGFRD
ncbi:SDR family NAD(P)-dependent oxidoreductase [Trujillonella endophytica]|uniref:NAD(P)-dependent dehydrogenase, short-chain alcohol dehydrogenase family n=1 Tax=Trujillonella endophytica TaxID=673521 RepID=A0A1H8SVT4_9ACTN|nr:SDR family NAD(P)-dependent oxidoreductase [Trujillella endophytica]SEO83099.1 NAD(P)-dependent dehydrogenase, short-chain alcohol dehydrogenase family [Trujillella endophytica]